jgi:hypothetical protein
MKLSYYKYNLATGLRRIKTKTALAITALSLAVGGAGGLSAAILGTAHAAAPSWQLNPSSITFTCGGSPYAHTLNTVTENQFTGDFTGTGSYVADPSTTWDVTGNVSGSNVTFKIVYATGNPGYTLNGVGTVENDGSVSGTVDNNCETFAMPAGTATHFSTSTQVVVTPANVQGWTTDDTRPGGSVTYVADTTAPGNPHAGALKLTTDSTTSSKAQYMHSASTPLSSVTDLSYYTKQNSASFAGGDASYQLPVCLGGVTGGTCSGFTTFVYEPYENGTVTPNVWQAWDVDAGQFWSSRTATGGGTCNTVAGFGGAPFYTLAALKAACPNAVAVGFGVNIGSNNPSYNVETDLVTFNGTTYNFEPATAPATVTLTSKDDCKNNGWMQSTNPTFKNQGDCVSFFATKGKNGGAGTPAAVNHFAYGSVTLSGPSQELNFALNDNGASATDTGTVIYSNPGASVTYSAPVTCVNVSGNTAYFAYVIPSGNPASGTWVVWKVVDGVTDTAGFTTAADQAGANALCEAANASVTNYAITAGDIKVQ